jgi:glycosyltransferase involved in cell wall biosynthesis
MPERVSVILPTHNRSLLLGKAIESILLQTHPNLEIVIIVDACTDETEYILCKYKDDARFKIIVSKKNLGGAEARNIGIKNASGEFLAFLDDDDTWLPDKVSKQLEVLQTRGDVCLVGCNFLNIRDGLKISPSNLPKDITLEDMLYKNVLGSFSFCMTRRKFVKGLSITKSLKGAQDWELWLNILLKTSLNIFILPDYLVNYNRSVNHYRLTTSSDAINSYSHCISSFWEFMNTSQRNYNKAFLLNLKSYALEPNSIVTYLKSLKYVGLTLNRYKPRQLLGLLFKFWINQWFRLVKYKK